ncbi:bifunctional 4-hydroxy-2-oxoglutarate aldolase/2-dehydro-3-deoxy-phosphogluconate aldolase [Brevundimonas naejangsanensis]|uniref:bifunctional 4-hydroxy-2-oxoglutarate aldolase/2-dehydro-3-deoxy-phosphogluconate aldolase n=1 Tax=Brevundimonas naejangsanensis TaxID=588932 RepID=UPI000EBF184B|nr:bifunctional 4-hydroxy-2-oxoglutarate aldolase/2-dehydro-3-deoxy-phosphogluconate aldolase [Brevundimonas naejangsanensis]HAC01736.1 bifunctional 4-hydroxy-2-oxoglutarate aldolase/2-dehydro-3-deoxy-phosphogluconate aldolase [Brevundimonas sp.]HCW49531.1 bifunctional 4-hydroxy-2-oxoglutarate aldolase/2-dehydro-3-deoxy-phosphogluconate aldolase [Brevundimonas sp.]
MRHDRLAVLTAIEAQGVVPVFYHPDVEVCAEVIRACARGGARAVEFTNRGDFAWETFTALAKEFAQTDPDIIMGVGSILDAATAALYLASGARFVVSPCLVPEVAQVCNRRMVAYSPGCGSVRDISEAQGLGCEIVKLFPGASVGGADFVRAVLGPMPWTKIMPTGGVDPDEASIRDWFGAGIVAAGMGSKLITKAAIEAKDWAGIEAQVRRTVETIAAFRKKG